jgi:hypothetical protein
MQDLKILRKWWNINKNTILRYFDHVSGWKGDWASVQGDPAHAVRPYTVPGVPPRQNTFISRRRLWDLRHTQLWKTQKHHLWNRYRGRNLEKTSSRLLQDHHRTRHHPLHQQSLHLHRHHRFQSPSTIVVILHGDWPIGPGERGTWRLGRGIKDPSLIGIV